MDAAIESMFAGQLRQRRARLMDAMLYQPYSRHLESLLLQVDDALDKVNKNTYGLCETCHESIEPERLLIDPLTRNCLDHLTMQEQQALEYDLELASRTQQAMLPKQEAVNPGWCSAYHYAPAGSVSGDYCDLIPGGTEDGFYFLTGDVAGKGVAASLLMSHLHAIFRTLTGLRQPIVTLMEQANRILCEGTLTSHYATLVLGKARGDGAVEICNAGHCPPLLVSEAAVGQVEPGGLPLGMFCSGRFETRQLLLNQGECLVLYTDGLSEAVNDSGEQYGTERLARVVQEHCTLPPEVLVRKCLQDLDCFRSGARMIDDLTLLILKRL